MTQTSSQPPETVKKSLALLKEQGRKVEVVGRIHNGKLELDSASLAELQRKYPNAHLSFVAVNAPFKG